MIKKRFITLLIIASTSYGHYASLIQCTRYIHAAQSAQNQFNPQQQFGALQELQAFLKSCPELVFYITSQPIAIHQFMSLPQEERTRALTKLAKKIDYYSQQLVNHEQILHHKRKLNSHRESCILAGICCALLQPFLWSINSPSLDTLETSSYYLMHIFSYATLMMKRHTLVDAEAHLMQKRNHLQLMHNILTGLDTIAKNRTSGPRLATIG